MKRLEWLLNLFFYYIYLLNNLCNRMTDFILIPIFLPLKIPALYRHYIKVNGLKEGTDIPKWFRETYIENPKCGHSIYFAQLLTLSFIWLALFTIINLFVVITGLSFWWASNTYAFYLELAAVAIGGIFLFNRCVERKDKYLKYFKQFKKFSRRRHYLNGFLCFLFIVLSIIGAFGSMGLFLNSAKAEGWIPPDEQSQLQTPSE